MLQFKAYVKNDKEVVVMYIAATSKNQAKLSIMKMENCPIEAIKKVNLLTHKMTRDECEFYHLDYFNNWINLSTFSEHYGLTLKEGSLLIKKGRI